MFRYKFQVFCEKICMSVHKSCHEYAFQSTCSGEDINTIFLSLYEDQGSLIIIVSVKTQHSFIKQKNSNTVKYFHVCVSNKENV